MKFRIFLPILISLHCLLHHAMCSKIDLSSLCVFIKLFIFQPEDITRNERMGRVPRVPAEAGQWVHGESEMFGFHSSVIESNGLHSRLRDGPWFRSHSEGNHAFYDVTIKKR